MTWLTEMMVSRIQDQIHKDIAMARQFDIREPSIEALRHAPVYFRYGNNKRRVLVDMTTARAVLACYDALNDTNKVKVERMVAGTPDQFQRLVAVCFRNITF